MEEIDLCFQKVYILVERESKQLKKDTDKAVNDE